MATLTYDNPATMYRECWQDGKLLCSYSVALMNLKGQWPPPPRSFFFGANIGDWKTGQMVGDSAAMSSNAVADSRPKLGDGRATGYASATTTEKRTWTAN